MLEPSDSAASIGDLLEGLGLRWAIVGALAAMRYRTSPRLTTDADFLVERDDRLVPALEAAGYEVRVIGTQGQPDEPPDALFVRGKGVKVDVLLPSVDYLELALQRATDHVITPEDVIVHKLIAWRPRDRDDVASILEAGHPLDEPYIEHWASEWDVLDRWRQAVSARR